MKTSFDKDQDLRVIKTKHAIINALWQLLYERSLKDISIKDICDKAMVNRSTFYLHFDDKQQLFVQSIYDEMFRINELTVAECKTDNIDEYYRVIGDITFNLLTENKQKYRMLFKNNDISLFLEPAQSFLSFNINRHIKAIKKTTGRLDLPSSLIAEFYSGGIISLAKWWVCTDIYVAPEKFRKLIGIVLSSFLAATDYADQNDFPVLKLY